MRFATACAAQGTFQDTLDEVVEVVRRQMNGASADLLVVFITADHAPRAADVSRRLRREFPGAVVLGCTASGVIGGVAEVEDRPAISLWAASLPDVGVTPFRLTVNAVGAPDGVDAGLVRHELGAAVDRASAMILLTDPFTCDGEGLGRTLDADHPFLVTVGGLASGGRGRNVLFWGDRIVGDGAVGVLLSGDVHVDAIVAQGCRPVGDVMTVTACTDHLAWSFDGEPALDRVQRTLQALDPASRSLFQRSPMLGVAMDDGVSALRRGDFLLRHVVGVDPARKGLAIGHRLTVGARVQFHVRDPATSAEDLDEHLQRAIAGGSPVEGALMFNCVGRGQGFYGRPDHDLSAVALAFGAPVAGFFCNGELGPVRGRTFLHGYTCVVAAFRQPAWN